ncbi:MAG: phospho-N-acetylmuramoyl-pentapeptide-transferase [Eubacteriaceae bacterium]|jgi:phospho-N-acetylmuramoyl-pentapeptide-transferase
MSNLQIGMLSLLIAAVSVWLLVPAALPTLHRLHFGQSIREEGPKSHQKKSGTPTMGGLLIQAGILIAVCIAGLITGKFSWYLVLIMIVYGLIGFIDDFIKVSKKHNLGLNVAQKLILQIAAALFFTIYAAHTTGTALLVPFAGMVDFGFWYYPFTFFAIVAVTNAVNLTDGLDGLAAGCTAVVMIFFLVGSFALSPAYSAFAGAVIGGCLGFIRNNSNPADIFMGDTGSMALGGALVGIAIVTRLQIFILIAGFIFVLEALSVVIQVGYFKISHGKRVFRMAPIHHHFELGGWSETRVVQVFWTLSALCTALAFLLL